MDEIKQLKAEIEAIKARNKRVEADKAWELSWARTSAIAISTYILLFIFLKLIGDNHPFLNAFISVILYLLSTSSVGFLKSWWLKRKYKT